MVERKYDDNYFMCFGELDGAVNYENQTLTIKWGDGTEDVISFNREIERKGNGLSHISDEFFLNGERTSNPIKKVKE